MKIVFLGDCVTDGDRDRNDENSLGNGYVKILSDKLKPIYPDMDIELINKGISGINICELCALSDSEIIPLKPDAVVIMCGIDEILAHYVHNEKLELQHYESRLNSLLTNFKRQGIAVIFLEPFLLPSPDKLRMRKLFNEQLAIIRKVAKELSDEYVAYDEMLAGVSARLHYKEYSLDGIHPTHRCSRLIADQAIKAIRKHLL